jgi:hypothetical protein
MKLNRIKENLKFSIYIVHILIIKLKTMQPISKEQFIAALSYMYSSGRMDGLADSHNERNPDMKQLQRQPLDQAISTITEALRIKEETNKLVLGDDIILN